MCLYPHSSGVKNERLEHRGVSPALRVPPDTEAGSEQRGGLPCGRVCDCTPFSEGKQRREGPQHRARLTIALGDVSLFTSPLASVRRSRAEPARRRSKGTLGEGEGWGEEGGLEPAELITRIVLDSYSSEEYRQLCCLWSMPSVKACAPVHSFEEPTFPPSKGWPMRLPRSHFLA